MFKEFLKIMGESLHIEKYAGRKGVLQNIDPRIKLIGFTCVIIVAVLLQSVIQFFFLLVFLVILAVVSRLPLRAFFERQALVMMFSIIIVLPLPFITPGLMLFAWQAGPWLIRITYEGIYHAIFFTMRIWVCIAALSLLTLTTRFTTLLHGMQRLRFPRLFIQLTAMTYRFIFLFTDEAYRMGLAREARTVKKERIVRLRTWQIISSMVATLFIRAYERGEKVYQAMQARGFQDQFRLLSQLQIGKSDWTFISMLTLMMFLIYFAPFLIPSMIFGVWF